MGTSGPEYGELGQLKGETLGVGQMAPDEEVLLGEELLLDGKLLLDEELLLGGTYTAQSNSSLDCGDLSVSGEQVHAVVKW